MNAPEVKVVVDASNTKLARLYIDGKEFCLLTGLKYSGAVAVDEIRISKLEITFIGDILVERSNA